MSELEERKQLIKERLGGEAIKILEGKGIDVDSAIHYIISDKLNEEAELTMKASGLDVNIMMTSELAYFSVTPTTDDFFGKEYVRRLKMLGLFDEQINSVHASEKTILEANPDEQRKKPWIIRFYPLIDPESLPKSEELTLSEFIIISDQANASLWRDHEHLSEEAWQAVCIAACCTEYSEGRYAKAFDKRTEKLGWLKEQSKTYTANECHLIAMFKWGYKDRPDPWTKESTDLGKYRR